MAISLGFKNTAGPAWPEADNEAELLPGICNLFRISMLSLRALTKGLRMDSVQIH